MKRVILAILFPVTAWATPPSTPVTAATNQQTITVGGSASSNSLNGLASSAETTLSGGVASSGAAGLGQSSAPQGYGGQSGTVAATGHVGYISGSSESGVWASGTTTTTGVGSMLNSGVMSGSASGSGSAGYSAGSTLQDGTALSLDQRGEASTSASGGLTLNGAGTHASTADTVVDFAGKGYSQQTPVVNRVQTGTDSSNNPVYTNVTTPTLQSSAIETWNAYTLSRVGTGQAPASTLTSSGTVTVSGTASGTP